MYFPSWAGLIFPSLHHRWRPPTLGTGGTFHGVKCPGNEVRHNVEDNNELNSTSDPHMPSQRGTELLKTEVASQTAWMQ